VRTSLSGAPNIAARSRFVTGCAVDPVRA